jgi:hypothetical protein
MKKLKSRGSKADVMEGINAKVLEEVGQAKVEAMRKKLPSK